MGHLRRFERAPLTSAVPPKADICLRCNICRNGPQADMPKISESQSEWQPHTSDRKYRAKAKAAAKTN